MPTYDYKCTKCLNLSSIARSYLDYDKIFICINCETPLQKQVSKPAVHFKGSGFYQTDYKDK